MSAKAPLKAIQQIMLGTVLGSEPQALETLTLAKQAGFDGIELCGYMIRKVPAAVKLLTRMAGMPVGRGGHLDWPALLKQAELRVVAVHEDLNTISQRPDEMIRNARALGTDTIVISGMYRFNFTDRQSVTDLAERMNRAGRALLGGGVHLLYHSHSAELLRVDREQTAFEILMQQTDPELVNFEFDSYWPTDAGADALAMMRALGGRMKLYHINDRGTRVRGASMTPILKCDSMELGDGNMPLDRLITQALSVNVGAVILESHRNWVDKSPIKSFQRSAQYLNRVL